MDGDGPDLEDETRPATSESKGEKEWSEDNSSEGSQDSDDEGVDGRPPCAEDSLQLGGDMVSVPSAGQPKTHGVQSFDARPMWCRLSARTATISRGSVC